MRQARHHAAAAILALVGAISLGCSGGGGTTAPQPAQTDPPPSKMAPTITWATPGAITYGTALTGAQLNATASVPGTFLYSPAAGSLLGAGTQTLTVMFTPTDAATYATAAASVSLTVSKATATLVLSALTPTYDGTAKAAIAATTPTGLAVTIDYEQGATVVAAPTNAGSYGVTASVNDPNYTGTAVGTLVIAQAAATVTFSAATLGQTYSGTQKTVATTTAPPGLTVSLSFTGTPTNAGSYPVTATVNDPNYNGSAASTLVIGKATPVITWASPSAITFGAALNATQLDASANVSGTFVYLPASGVVLEAGTQTLAATFTPADTADYTTAPANVNLTVNKANATVTFNPGALSQTYNGTPKTVATTTTPPGLAVNLSFTGTPTNAGSYSVTATISDPNYTGSTSGTLVIAQATALVSFTAGALNQTYSGTQKTVATNTTPPGLVVNLSFTGTPTNAGSYPVTATINDPNYTGSASGTLVITQAAATVNFSAGALSQIYGGTAKTVAAITTPPGLAVNVSFTGTPTNAGSYPVTATINDPNYTGSTSGILIIAQATPVITWPAPTAITPGTTLSITQLNATTNVQGTFAYTPPLGTALGLGSQTLMVTFTPTDTTDYTTANTSVTIDVTFPPSIGTQPLSQTIAVGQTATFTVSAIGAAPLSYQWRLNGTPINGALDASYTTLAAQAQDSGSMFDVVVTNADGSQTSTAATLTVNVPPSVTSQPANQIVTLGQPAIFTVVATGTAPLSYQWQRNGDDISGATSSSYTTPATTILDDGALFTVVVDNAVDPVTSSAATLTVNLTTTVDVATYHNDSSRSGQNLSEVILTPANVNSATFGLSAFLPADGQIDAQPLYLSNVAIPGMGTHNVIYAATENDSVYAFDALTGDVLWQTSVLGIGEIASDDRGCSEITPEIGITATPVIDRTRGPNGAIYIVAMSTDGAGNYFQRLHALDIATGAELFSGPTTITATFPGTGDGTDGTSVVFNPAEYKERAGVLLSNGVIYTAWASHCNTRPYTGWVMAFDANTLASTSVLNITPNGSGGAISMGGAGLAADSSGNVYLLSSRGTFDTTLNAGGFPAQGDFGNAFLKLSTSGALAIADYFAPSNTVQESAQNEDVGSGGLLLLPDLTDSQSQVHHLAIGAGQDTNLYVVNRDPNSMGEFNSTGDQIYQEIDGALAGGSFTAPAYYNNTLYFGPSGGPSGSPVTAFSISNAQLATTPAGQTSNNFASPGTAPAISANGNNSAILWAVQYDPAAAILYAYDATNLSHELYDSTQADSGRDNFGGVNQFVTPTIANANVFVGTTTGIAVFGLLPSGPSGAAPSIVTQPIDQLVLPGQAATFAVAVTGSAPLSYQWQQNGSNISGANSSSYTTGPALAGDDRTVYSVVVSNIFGSAATNGALLEVNYAPLISAQPSNQSVTTGQTATFSASVLSPYPISYKWQINGIDIPGANSSSYTTPPAVLADSGEQFTVVVSNGLGDAASSAATLQVSPPPATAIYYADFYGGSDGNNGASSVTPWQYAPGMSGCAANCALAVLHPGDRVIFRGGVTWDGSAFPMAATWSGSVENPIYYGVDQTWFYGVTWTRPVFDLGGTVWMSAPVLAKSASNLVFDNLEIENQQVTTNGSAAPLGGISVSGGSSVTVQNCYVHGWSLANPGPGSDATPFGGIAFYNGASGGAVRNCTFDGSPAGNSGTGVFGAQIVQGNVFEQMPNAISVSDPEADVSGNQIFSLTGSVDPLAQRNAILVSGGGKIDNNIVHDLPANSSALYLESFQAGVGNTQSVYNNLIWNTGGNDAITIDPGQSLGTSASSQSVYNNTIEGGAAGCMLGISGPPNLTNVTVENNLCISDQSSTQAAWCGSGAGGNLLCGTILGLTFSSNVLISTQTASSLNQGYTVANGFQPASPSASTVSAGLNLSAACAGSGATLCSDRLGIARPGGLAAWDAGAYQYQSVAASLPPSITEQPVSATVVNGNTATFSVVAIGTAPLSYQWQADGAPINGATSSTYPTGAINFSNDQTQYTVVITNPQGSVTSSVATLHVTDSPGELNAGNTALDFGTVYSSATASLAVTLTNTGNSNVDISNVGISGAGFGASGIPSGLIIAPGESSTLNVTFSPASAGTFTGSITIASDAGNSPLTIPTFGVGAATSTHAAQLSWNASTSVVSGYNVYRGTASGGPYTQLNPAPVGSTLFADIANTVSGSAQTLFTSQAPEQTGVIDGPNVTYELGTVFQAAVPGQITAVRFWKDANDIGTHVGNIWSANGQLLASAQFANESASGWQQQVLAFPLSIQAGLGYIVSVNTPTGYYVETGGGLTTPIVNQYLSTIAGNNGVYGPQGQFPTNSYNDANYFRDVVFLAGGGGVQPGQTYYYVVTSVSLNGVESAPSNESSATIP